MRPSKHFAEAHMRLVRPLGLFVVALALVTAVPLCAQFTTGSLVGTVTAADGSALPGVTVTLSSPALQGTRTAITGETGGYHFPALPPGNYTVAFELDSMQRQSQRVA